ncbi:MAG: PD-(D/E)XK nuclease family protein, partial [Prevotella sp.]|nr:PD-(D/E)XK nuclease family protein [Prevotella sp.]
STWLQENDAERQKAGSRTAIVLCDESLLPAVIHAMPENTLANITTGYPLAQTPVAALIAKTTAKWKGPSADKEKTRRLFDELLETIKASCHTSAKGGEIRKDASFLVESAFRAYTAAVRIRSLVESGDLTADLTTLSALIRQVIGQTTIPFHGEPVKGVQIMGMLETRNLDFDHLLILSCGEGNMPKGMNQTSMIPYNIRRAHELPTSDNRAAVYAYHFYRLLSRADDITITYNNATTDGQTGQQSRFMMQLLTESHHSIRRYQLVGGQLPMTTRPTAAPIPHPSSLSPSSLSLSAINRYLRCQLQFYYAHVQHIKEPQTDDPTDNRVFGNIFHRAAELAYLYLAPNGGEVTRTAITDLLANDAKITALVEQAVKDQQAEPDGNLSIIKTATKRYLVQLLDTDATLAPFSIVGLEIEVKSPLPFSIPPRGDRGGLLHGFIDRLDLIRTADREQRIRVVDYKTGRAPRKAIQQLEQVFSPDCIDDCHGDYYLQAMLYSLIVSQSEKLNPRRLPVSPALLFIRNAGKEGYDPTLAIGGEAITDIEHYRQPFEAELSNVLREIYSTDTVFEPTGYPDRCPDCPYRTLCFTPHLCSNRELRGEEKV